MLRKNDIDFICKILKKKLIFQKQRLRLVMNDHGILNVFKKTLLILSLD